TVGWFTALYPLVVDLTGAEDESAAVVAAKEASRRVPGEGVGYGVLRYLRLEGGLGEAAVEELGPEVSFNYLGRLDLAVDASSPFRLAPESPGSEQAEEDRSGHLFDVTAQILEGRLQLDWAYRGEWHRSATIAALMERWVERLERLAAICRRPEAGAYTPSDFPLAELEGPQLQQILGSLSEIRSLRPKERLIEDIYPLAPAQQGMLFHSLLAPQAELYVEQLRVTLSGKVEGERLRQAWQAVMARHEVLRTSFLWHGLPRPLQVVWAEAPVPWEEEDWRQVPAAERQQRFEALMAEDRRRGFRLDRAPLMRFRLIRWEGDDYRAVWSHHHILLDGWCRGRVFLHFLEACAALRVRASVPRGDERPYRDFIAWLQAQDLQAAERYWRRRLEDFAHPTPLSVDRPVPLEGTEGSPQRAIPVSAALTADLVASCRRWGVTLAAAVHGAWALLLARYSGLRDVVVGTVVSGRPAELPGVEEMVGLFINTLPLRLAVPADATAEDWLGQVQRAQGELGQFEYSPLAEVQKWSGVTGGDPLFESIVVVQNLPPELPRTEGAGGTDRGAEEASVRPANAVADPGFELFDLDGSERTDFPLTLVAEPGERLELRFEYEAARFDDATVGRMLGHLQELLTGMVTDGRQRLWRLPLLTASERHQLLGEWSSGGGADLPPADLYQLFATSAVAAPEAPALISGDRRWSYRSLAVAAEALAGRLNRSGVGAEGRVGLITGRSPEMVLGLLGILAAGGVAVPLDPRDPPSRLSALASGAGVEVILMGEGLGLNSIADRLEASVPVVLCSLSEQDGVSEGDAGSATVPPRPAAAPHPEAAACCFFTSGSTGEPKAVLLSHAALTRFAVEMAQALELQPEDRWLQFAAPTFDVVLEELLPAWTVGAAVIQPEAQGPLAPAELERQMSEHRASLVELPAAYWQVWVDEMAAAGRRPPATLRRLVLGAEPPDLAALQRWLDWGVPVTQVFGLTETGCTSTLYPVPKGWGSSSGRAPTEAARLPVGRPLAGSRVYVLGAELEPLPEGAPGELFIGGEGLARGYGGRPAETAHRFLPDPFAAAPGARLYRTGDVACWRAGGLLDFLGRLDDQVKVRGVRIECGEIEAQLRRLPSVVAAAVVPQGESAGDRRLVAHVVFDGDEVPPMELTANLAGQLRQRLPEALVPAHFVSWPALPLTRHGKVDRRALGQAHHGRPEAASRPPRTALEKRLAEPWCAVLGVAAVGAEDNFFDSGGDSLSLIRLASQLSQTLERDIPLVDLFTYPSIAALARNLEGGGGEEVQDQARQRAEIRQGARQQARQRARRRRRAADTDSIPAGDPS
ncbi:MAG: amino acid adenylation domain-containing protein, partial [Acidobacteriota bacterium]|nr:amino acid adenylation domain-containing protein [Acidobacteriota bacterium]